jgi:hypothetical protein
VRFVSGSLAFNRIGDAGAAAIGAGLVLLPQLQTLEYVVCPTVRAGSWRVLARERGAMTCACAVLLFVRFVSGSLAFNRIGDEGVAAIGAGLVQLPQLQTLKYVLRPVVCTGLWRALARDRGPLACVCAGVVVCAACVRAAFAATVSVPWVRRPLVQAWSTCPSCRH